MSMDCELHAINFPSTWKQAKPLVSSTQYEELFFCFWGGFKSWPQILWHSSRWEMRSLSTLPWIWIGLFLLWTNTMWLVTSKDSSLCQASVDSELSPSTRICRHSCQVLMFQGEFSCISRCVSNLSHRICKAIAFLGIWHCLSVRKECVTGWDWSPQSSLTPATWLPVAYSTDRCTGPFPPFDTDGLWYSFLPGQR